MTILLRQGFGGLRTMKLILSAKKQRPEGRRVRLMVCANLLLHGEMVSVLSRTVFPTGRDLSGAEKLQMHGGGAPLWANIAGKERVFSTSIAPTRCRDYPCQEDDLLRPSPLATGSQPLLARLPTTQEAGFTMATSVAVVICHLHRPPW